MEQKRISSIILKKICKATTVMIPAEIIYGFAEQPENSKYFP